MLYMLNKQLDGFINNWPQSMQSVKCDYIENLSARPLFTEMMKANGNYF